MMVAVSCVSGRRSGCPVAKAEWAAFTLVG